MYAGGGWGGGYFGHPSALGYFATVSAGTHTHAVAHTRRALCQASCSLAGAGNAPERVVASICSTGERLGCVSESVCVCVYLCLCCRKTKQWGCRDDAISSIGGGCGDRVQSCAGLKAAVV